MQRAAVPAPAARSAPGMDEQRDADALDVDKWEKPTGAADSQLQRARSAADSIACLPGRICSPPPPNHQMPPWFLRARSLAALLHPGMATCPPAAAAPPPRPDSLHGGITQPLQQPSGSGELASRTQGTAAHVTGDGSNGGHGTQPSHATARPHVTALGGWQRPRREVMEGLHLPPQRGSTARAGVSTGSRGTMDQGGQSSRFRWGSPDSWRI